jgi:hypothetical protein
VKKWSKKAFLSSKNFEKRVRQRAHGVSVLKNLLRVEQRHCAQKNS